jgi:type 1 glutamine amidotransferase
MTYARDGLLAPHTIPRRLVGFLGIAGLGVGLLVGLGSDTASAKEPRKNPVARRVVFIIGEDEYKTNETLPVFAKNELEARGLETVILSEDPADKNSFPGLLKEDRFDLLFVSVRRRPLPEAQMAVIKRHLAAGRPLVGIRTASHAFAFNKPPLPPERVEWPKFDLEVLGGRYTGHYANKGGTDVNKVAGVGNHPIFEGLGDSAFPFHSGGTLYFIPEISPSSKVLLRGKCENKGKSVEEPVAWTHAYGKSRVFYTSLGHPDDFKIPAFRRLLANAVSWALDHKAPRQARDPR